MYQSPAGGSSRCIPLQCLQPIMHSECNGAANARFHGTRNHPAEERSGTTMSPQPRRAVIRPSKGAELASGGAAGPLLPSCPHQTPVPAMVTRYLQLPSHGICREHNHLCEDARPPSSDSGRRCSAPRYRCTAVQYTIISSSTARLPLGGLCPGPSPGPMPMSLPMSVPMSMSRHCPCKCPLQPEQHAHLWCYAHCCHTGTPPHEPRFSPHDAHLPRCTHTSTVSSFSPLTRH